MATIISNTKQALLDSGNNYARQAANWTRVRVIFNILIFAFTILETFHIWKSLAWVVGLYIASVGTILSQIRSLESHLKYRRARLNLLLSDSFECDATMLDNAELLAPLNPAISSNPPSGERFLYYTSQLQPGTERFKSNLAETLFFASNLYHNSKVFVDRIFLVPFFIITLIALLAPLCDQHTIMDMSHILVLIVLLVTELHLVIDRIHLSHADKTSKQLLNRLGRTSVNTPLELYHIFAVYEAVSFATPGPFFREYKRAWDSLNTEWNLTRQKYET
jgi:hypothetical protein